MSNINKSFFRSQEGFISILVVISFILGILLSNIVVNKSKVLPMQREAISKGFAEWIVVDQETGATEFAWKTVDIPAKQD